METKLTGKMVAFPKAEGGGECGSGSDAGFTFRLFKLSTSLE